MKIDADLVYRLLSTVDAGLCPGVGVPIPGKMCVEAAVCYAMGLPHGDEPTCVEPAVRSFKIALNDSPWSSDAARATGMRKLAVAQLGSKGVVNGVEFSKRIAEKTIRRLLPVVLRQIGLTKEAARCEQEGSGAAAYAAADAAAYAADAARAAARAADAAAYAARAAAYAAAYAADAAAYAARAAAYAADAAAHAAAGSPLRSRCAPSAADAAARAAADAARAARAAARAAAYAADAAAHAAYAAARAARAAARDSILNLSAEIALETLIELKSPGVEWLHLCD